MSAHVQLAQITWRHSPVPAKTSHLNFYTRVYEVVRLIPRGKVATYGQIAAIVSHSGAARTVGWALRALREGTDVPWHRVINARGTVSTSYQEGGEILQQTVLEEEGITFDALGRADLVVYGWEGLDWPEIEALRQKWQKESPE
jgi:methylated-DNA-protein-cysteine methyltransferase-like protein